MEAFPFKYQQQMLIHIILFLLNSLAGTLSYYDNNIELRYFHYQDGHGYYVVNNGTSGQSFTIYDKVLIDLFADYYVYKLFIEFEDEYGETRIGASCYGSGPLPRNRVHCRRPTAHGRTLSFECRCMTRFIEARGFHGFEVANINVTGHGVFFMLYAGCYEYRESGDYLVEDLSQCIFDCQRRNYSLAGVKNKYCTCLNGFRGSMLRNLRCNVECLKLQICGGRRHIMLYFANYDEFIQNRVSNTSYLCVHDLDDCRCQHGLSGINCDIRDCWYENGQCRNMACEKFENQPIYAPGGVCRCPRGHHLQSFWSCVDIDECETGIASCTHRQNCINVPGSFRCSCKDEFLGRCEEGRKSPSYFFVVLGILIFVPSLALFYLKILKMHKPLGSSDTSQSITDAPAMEARRKT